MERNRTQPATNRLVSFDPKRPGWPHTAAAPSLFLPPAPSDGLARSNETPSLRPNEVFDGILGLGFDPLAMGGVPAMQANPGRRSGALDEEARRGDGLRRP